MSKKTIDIIIRGFLYRENWTPLSNRRRKFKNYTIDFLQCADDYKKLLKKLREKYNINLYFTTYNTTPHKQIEKIMNEFNPHTVFLSEEFKSSQFTTVKTVLESNEIKNNNNFLFILRSDMYINDKLIDLIYNHIFNDNILYVLCKENNKQDKVIDIFHAFSPELKTKFYNYISIPGLKDAHRIHKHIYTRVLSIKHECVGTDACKEFYSLYPTKIE